jgi:hypothetical protein
MTDSQANSPSMSPEVMRYLKGVTDESLQFDFLIGDWSVEGTRFGPTGEVAQKFGGKWHAEYLHDKRIVLDDFSVCLPTGQEISSFVTLRTYCTTTGRWEMAGLAAFQPAVNGKWYGNWSDGEMLTYAEGVGPDGRAVKNEIRFYDIKRGSFKWESRISLDDGKSWIKISSLVVTRK